MAALFSRILCPIDFDRDSMEALELASQLARQSSATVCLLTVIAAPTEATELPPVPLDPNPLFEAVCRHRLEALAQEKLSGISHEIFVASGNAAPQILKLAADEGIDLIVMGTHGRKGVKHFILGSVAERVVRESPVPVLTIRPKAGE
ncbi:MAG: universal stress protein [Candidatus Binatus sp.]|uniref:universal stress protein n=1 Tax=Candidatus Binatus sp. TaxID=2811406 RepID=UPI002719153C|nr:universal stress protein [Candidatus Binatus sp.]MDO8435031.1 universal stress protein [Candidatus Binatus sp.]